MPMIEDFSPAHITIHPRIGTQQYKGEVDLEAFANIYNSTSLNIIYNGDICEIDQLKLIEEKFPKIIGVMLGRGLLANPAMARVYIGGKALSEDEYITLHNSLFAYYNDLLCGETTILNKIKPFWE